MKFLLDMPISPKIADWLKETGYDAVHARDLNLSKAPDEEILKEAQRQERILLTMDLDFPRIFSLSKIFSIGVILFRSRDPRPKLMQERLSLLLKTHSESQIASSIVIIEDFRIRMRNLPI